VGDVADSPDQRFEFTLRNLTAGEHTVAVRAYDEFENLTASEVTFTVPAAKK
jgi:hypothetical protein